jgi:hypothetical protein
MIPQQLQDEVADLQRDGHVVEVSESEGWLNVLIKDYPVPPGYNKPKTDLLIRLPVSYPNGKPDMFWTSPELVLQNGKVPKNADAIEPALGRQWRRFSWHMQTWNPGRDGLRVYLEFIGARLSRSC